MHDHAGPGRAAEAGEAGTSNAVRAAAARRSRAGIKPFKRRPQADNLFLAGLRVVIWLKRRTGAAREGGDCGG